MYLIKSKITHQYLQKWFAREKFGHWEDKPKGFSKKDKERITKYLNDIEVIYKRGVK